MPIGSTTDPRMNNMEKDFGFLIDTNGHTHMYAKNAGSQYLTHGSQVEFKIVRKIIQFDAIKNGHVSKVGLEIELAIIKGLRRGFDSRHKALAYLNTQAHKAIRKLPRPSQRLQKKFNLI